MIQLAAADIELQLRCQQSLQQPPLTGVLLVEQAFSALSDDALRYLQVLK